MNSCLTLIFWLQVYFDNLLLRKLQIFFFGNYSNFNRNKISRMEYLLKLEKMYGEEEFY